MPQSPSKKRQITTKLIFEKQCSKHNKATPISNLAVTNTVLSIRKKMPDSLQFVIF